MRLFEGQVRIRTASMSYPGEDIRQREKEDLPDMCTQTTYDPGKVKLTARQRRFIEEYCVARRRAGAASGAMFNATQAAIAAGYSKKTAAVIAHQNLRKLHIREAIDARLGELSKRSLMQANEILDHLSAMARVPILDEEGRLLDVGQARVVVSVLELLAKYHKLLTERHEVGGMDDKPIQFALPRTEDSEPANLPEEGAP